MRKWWHLTAICKILSRKLENKQSNGCLSVRHGSHLDFLVLLHKFFGAFTPRGSLEFHICDIRSIWYHSDNNHYIISPKLKSTFSSSKHHCSLCLDFFFLDVFSPEDDSFVKQKAACSRLGSNNKATCGWAVCHWKQIGRKSFPLYYEN